MPGIVSSALRAALLTGCLLLAGTAAAAPAETVRREVGEPLLAAKASLAKKRFQDALAQVEKAQGVGDRTAYETYLVDEIKAYALQGLNRNAEALAAMEAAVRSGKIPPADLGVRLHILANLAFKVKDWDRSLDYAGQAIKAGVKEADVRQVMGQSYFMKQDFAHATPLFAGVVADEEKAGRKPTEAMIVTVMGSAVRQNDDAAFLAGLEKMVTYYPRTNYWHDVVTVARRQPGFSDDLRLDADRLMAATGSFSKGARYMEFAQALLVENLAGEAEAALKKGYAVGMLGKGDQAGRHQRLMDLAKTQADAERAGGVDQRLAAATTGPDLVAAGMAYAGIGRYPQAMAAITAGLKKGGLKDPQHVQLRLGVVQLAAGQADKAHATLSALTKADGTAVLARLWLLESRGIIQEPMNRAGVTDSAPRQGAVKSAAER
jgi:tetratricopeptide (TPR) repeat protein